MDERVKDVTKEEIHLDNLADLVLAVNQSHEYMYCCVENDGGKRVLVKRPIFAIRRTKNDQSRL